jgi:serine/threonine protein kinase
MNTRIDRMDSLVTFPELPFTPEEVSSAFPELIVEMPELGRGSFKVAYTAYANGDVRVLKVINSFPILGDPDDFDLNSIPDRITREIAGMTATSCPHLVTLLGEPQVRQIGSASYLSYEEPLYPGGTLEERLRVGALDAADARELVVALLTASKALWNSAGIVHRDIKPGNIVYSDEGIPVLLDLGLALYTTMSSLTNSGLSSPRTDRYAAPEQFELRREAKIDFRTDQYLIGIVGFEALLGRHPFWDPTVTLDEYFDRMQNFSADTMDEISGEDDLKGVIARLLAPKPYRRFRTVDAPLVELGVTL